MYLLLLVPMEALSCRNIKFRVSAGLVHYLCTSVWTNTALSLFLSGSFSFVTVHVTEVHFWNRFSNSLLVLCSWLCSWLSIQAVVDYHFETVWESLCISYNNVGLNNLRGLFQPTWFCDSVGQHKWGREKLFVGLCWFCVFFWMLPFVIMLQKI